MNWTFRRNDKLFRMTTGNLHQFQNGGYGRSQVDEFVSAIRNMGNNCQLYVTPVRNAADGAHFRRNNGQSHPGAMFSIWCTEYST